MKDESVTPNAPIITIEEITDTGRVVFAFSEDMWVIPDDELKFIKSSIVTDLSGVTRPLFNVNVRPDEDTPEEKLGLTWEPISMIKRKLEVQVDFENPSYISVAQEGQDFLEIEINGWQMFFSAKGQPLELTNIHETTLRRFEEVPNSESNNFTILSEKIPKQLPKGNLHEMAMAAMGSVADSS